MNDITKGGRGKKAPYKTTIVRVPDKLLPIIHELIDDYRKTLTLPINDSIKSQAEIIELAKSILSQKKSAKISLTKLLQVLYEDNNINL